MCLGRREEEGKRERRERRAGDVPVGVCVRGKREKEEQSKRLLMTLVNAKSRAPKEDEKSVDVHVSGHTSSESPSLPKKEEKGLES